MNTQIKKVIFCSMMTAEDFVDAFEKLIKLSLTRAQVYAIIPHNIGERNNKSPRQLLRPREIFQPILFFAGPKILRVQKRL